MHLNSGEFANPVPVSVHSCIPGVTQLLKYYFAFGILDFFNHVQNFNFLNLIRIF